MNTKSTKAILLVIAIALTGIFRHYVGLFFTIPLSFFIDSLGGDYQQLESSLSFLAKDGQADAGLGIFFYYGTYLLLHVALIHVLFPKKRRLKIGLVIILAVLVIGTGAFTILFKSIGLENLGGWFHNVFDQLAGRPLILFVIEGGGLIYERVDSLVARDQ